MSSVLFFHFFHHSFVLPLLPWLKDTTCPLEPLWATVWCSAWAKRICLSMRASTWTLGSRFNEGIKGFKTFGDKLGDKGVKGLKEKFNPFAESRRPLSTSQRSVSGCLAKARHSWPSRASSLSMRGSMVPGMSGFRGPPFVGATRGMRILVATPVNEGKQVDMEFADGTAYRCLA